MKTIFRWSLLAAVLLLLAGCAEKPLKQTADQSVSTVPVATKSADSSDATVPNDLVVHEWGTFTTFAGSGGGQLEFRANVEGELPYFVYNRARQAGVWGNPFQKRLIYGSVRMETPVTYFYTDQIQSVDVSVQFPNGKLTEFYPPVRTMSPPFSIAELGKNFAATSLPLLASLETVADSQDETAADISIGELDWGTLTLIPPRFLEPSIPDARLRDIVHRKVATRLAPQAHDGQHYTAARVPDSAYVHLHLPENKNQALAQGDYFEKFLFYRGVGDFHIPLEVRAHGLGKFTVSNQGEQAFRSLIVVTRGRDGIRFQSHPALGPGQEVDMRLPAEAQNQAALVNVIEAALVDAGLFEAEAQAMVKTWNSSWFQELGTRVFYLLPQDMTDSLLPLQVKPAPRETVRVMVGRYELLTPEDEGLMTAVISQGLRERQAQQSQPVEGLPPVLAERGRFAAPALQVLADKTEEPQLHAEMQRLLKLAR